MPGEKHTPHLVSAKVALYSHDLKHVLLMKYAAKDWVYGLPGGHLDANETPDEAMARELVEELTLSGLDLKRVDFFFRNGPGDTLILGYVGIAPENITPKATRPDKEIGVWVAQDEVTSVDIAAGYVTFILDNWPK